MEDEKKSSKGRTRNYATVVYSESAPVDWEDILASHLVPAFISPYHCDDVNPTGEHKKEHYHVIIMFDSVKTAAQAREVFDTIGGVGCEPIKSIRGYARYLCHLDNPEKAQYDVNAVRSLCGADYMETIQLISDRYAAIKEMMFFCKDNHICSYAELLEYCSDEKYDWFRILCDSGTYVMKEYLKSVTWTKKHYETVDFEIGEIKEI